MFQELIEAWDGEHVVVRYDPPTGTWMFVCIHSSRLGPAGGGTRMKVYQDPADALQDGMRLAAAMTLKFAVAGLPMGGGKAVLAVPGIPQGEEERARIVGRYAELLCSLGGSYRTGPDMNTGEFDMDLIDERCPYAFGRSPSRGGSGGSAPDTAIGVFHGIRASVAHAFGSPDLSGRLLLVQGVGGVGGRLAGLLVEAGAKVLVSDVDQGRVRATVDRHGVIAVPPGEVIGTECDVFVPCALGGVLDRSTIPRLRCRVVAGAANNQLAEPADAERLREAGILYAPDYVINGGGALHLIGLEALSWTRPELERRLEGIGDTLTRIFRSAEAGGMSTEAAAERLAAERLAAAS